MGPAGLEQGPNKIRGKLLLKYEETHLKRRCHERDYTTIFDLEHYINFSNSISNTFESTTSF